jgi:hypothetical protein
MHQTSLRELTTLGMKNAENLAIPSVRNDVSRYNTRILGVSIACGERNDLCTTTFFFLFFLKLCTTTFNDLYTTTFFYNFLVGNLF